MRLAIAITLLCLLGRCAVFAQDVRGSITGIVNDPTGAPAAGAVVVVTNIAQNISISTETNETGNYVFPLLAPGTYRLSIERAGFRKYVREGIVLQTQDKARIDAQLEIGEVTQSVTVDAAAPLLETETATRSQVISNELVQNVPTQGRNPFQLAWSAPGVIKSGDWRYLRAFDIGGTSGFSINGGRNQENEVLLDGISNVRGSRTVVHVPTMESIQEFKVLTNTYDAAYGRTGGGVVSIVTRSGSNGFHGTAFEYFQNDRLNANQSELNRGGVKKSPLTNNTFGIEASGPIFIPKLFDGRNRLFWLVSYEGLRQRSADPGAATFPLLEWRNGDFSSLRNANGQPVLLYDPQTTNAAGLRQPFPNNQIPSNRLSPVSLAVMKFYPAPTGPGDGPAHVNNYIYPSKWVGNMDQWIGRADFVANSRNWLFFRYGQNPYTEFRGLVWNGSLQRSLSIFEPDSRAGRRRPEMCSARDSIRPTSVSRPALWASSAVFNFPILSLPAVPIRPSDPAA
jgi:hypothetical protein